MVAVTPAAVEARVLPRRPSRLLEGWDRYASDPLAVVGLAILVIVLLAAVFAPWVAPFDPNY